MTTKLIVTNDAPMDSGILFPESVGWIEVRYNDPCPDDPNCYPDVRKWVVEIQGSVEDYISTLKSIYPNASVQYA